MSVGAGHSAEHAQAAWGNAPGPRLPSAVSTRRRGPALMGVAFVVVAVALVVAAAYGAGPSAMLALAAAASSLAAVLVLQWVANERIRAAFARAEQAEAEQRRRADELAAVLAASENLGLAAAPDLAYDSMLAAITPAGASSIVILRTGEAYSVAAAYGPRSETLLGMAFSAEEFEKLRSAESPVFFRAAGDSAAGDSAAGDSAAGDSAAGDRMLGASAADPHAGHHPQGRAALAVRLVDSKGDILGALHIVDRRPDGIFEPAVVALAQLVARQISTAIENRALVGQLNDQLSEMERYQAQLVEASKLGAVGELAAAVAHEVNNPLTGILGFSELLLSELPPDDRRHEEAAVIRSEAIRARAIVRALLDFARPRPPQRIPTDLNELTRGALDLFRFHAADGGIRIDEAYGPLPEIALDPDGIKQVLLNLVSNSLRAMPRGGHLVVRTRLARDAAAVSVSDDGIGMDEAMQRDIFSPFFNARSGTGAALLGMSVCRQIVEAHGGTIETESAPGKGTTFTVWLPLARIGAGDEAQDGGPLDEPMGERPASEVEAKQEALSAGVFAAAADAGTARTPALARRGGGRPAARPE